MKKTIIYFVGVYDTLDLFTQELKNAFEEMGYGSFVYDAVREAESKEALIGRLDDAARAKKAGEPEQETFACVTFNNLGYNLSLSDRGNLWEVYGIPYINILMDHPFHYEKPLRLAPKTAAVLCTDRGHVAYLRRYFKNILRTDFLPHAGVGLGGRRKPLSDRSIDVLYAGALPIYTVAKITSRTLAPFRRWMDRSWRRRFLRSLYVIQTARRRR